MVTIQIDEATADGLERQAKQAGVTLVEYLRSLVAVEVPKVRPSWDELEQEFIRLSIEGGNLPPDFSREDIYCDHD